MDNQHGELFTNGMEALASIAFQFGPFFFAIFFMLVITRTARKWYATTRGEGVDPEERRAYRSYFRCSYVFGMALCATSVAWWFVSQWHTHQAFSGVIALRENEGLAAAVEGQTFFARELPRTDSRLALRDYQFVQVLDHPPHKGDKVLFYYWELQQLSGTGPRPRPTATIEVPITNSGAFPEHFQLEHRNGRIVPVRMP